MYYLNLPYNPILKLAKSAQSNKKTKKKTHLLKHKMQIMRNMLIYQNKNCVYIYILSLSDYVICV